MSDGPITIFDKSALQGLNIDEACWFGNFYRSNITPLFFVETLADLEKEVRDGRTPEEVVGNLASKTPALGAHVNIPHNELCISNLLGQRVAMDRVPVIHGGRFFTSEGRRGFSFGPPPEFEAFQRWQDGQFLEVERRFANGWRRTLAELDLEGLYKHIRGLGNGEVRVRTLQEAKAWSERFVRGDGRRYLTLRAALELLSVPDDLVPEIVTRWKAADGPALPEFAPYAAYVLCVDLFFQLAIGADLISRRRASNKVDIAYLYYLPFCMVFISNDKLHAKTAPLFLSEDQTFLKGDELKGDLHRLDEHYAALPAQIRERGIISFAAYPPLDGDYLTSALWDRFLPGWRSSARSQRRKEGSTKIMPWMSRAMEAARTAEGFADVEDADLVFVQRRVPIRMGKWRLLPPGVK